MNRQIRWTASVLLLAMAGAPALACEKTEGAPVMRLQVFSPLVMHQHGASTDVSVDAAGCVTTRFPAIDKRAGVHRYQLGDGEFAALKREVRSARLQAFDAAQLKRALEQPRAKSEGALEYFAADADIVQLTLAPGIADAKSASAKSIRWQGIESALMNRPDLVDLQSLAVVKSRLLQIGTDPRLAKEAAQ
jgi:hypothetical protein